MSLAAGITLAAAASVETFWQPTAAVGALGVTLLGAALAAGWVGLVPWSLVLVGGAYLTALLADGERGVDGSAPLYGAALLAVAELAYWSLELRGPGGEERRLLARRAAAVAILALVSVVLGALVLAVTAMPAGGGLLWDAVGVLAAAGALALIVRLAHREPL